jgi:hypothetical protein
MELEKALRRLEIKNDFEKLSVDELKEKYAKDVDTYSYFLNAYSGITIEGSESHSKVRELLNFIKDERVKGTKLEQEVEWLIEYLNMEEGITVKTLYRKETDYQGYDLKLQTLGITDTYGYVNYPELTSMLYEETKKINECYKAKPDFPNFGDYRFMIFKAMDEAEEKEIEIGNTDKVKDYYNRFPLLNLCHDVNFVIAFNNLLRDKNFDDKNELINLYYNVVDFSLTFNPINKDFDEKKYRKAVSIANSRIKDYQKSHRESKVYKR